MIHLRVRTEGSFRETYAPLSRVVARLAEVGATAAGIVDLNGSTWFHVRAEAELTKAGIQPMFGAEFAIADRPGKAWALAADPSSLYSLLSRATPEAPTPLDAFLEAPGLVRFAGSALGAVPEALEAGVYLDLNPGAPLGNATALRSAKGSAARLILTSDNLYARPEDRRIHELMARGSKATRQHILSEGEMVAAFASTLNQRQIAIAFQNAHDIAAKLNGVVLRKAPIITIEGDIRKETMAGKKARLAAGQIAEWTEVYQARMERELKLIKEKGYDSYFLIVADMIRWAKERMLVGPARGSSAGSLVCYLMGITEVDPIVHGLMFERFVDITRTDIPDIDIDFPDTKRDLVYDYLREKYGTENVARIGTISEYKARSALAEVGKRLNVPPWETQPARDAMFTRSSGDARANNCLTDTLNETDPGRRLVEKYPNIVLAGELEGHASHTGMHAAGVIVCNEPITNFCAVRDGMALLDKLDAEALNLLKIDALGLKTLTVIEDCGMLTAEQLYSLPLDDQKVFDLINEGKYSGIFQWEGQALQSVTGQLTVQSFADMGHITALARPGPLIGGAAGAFTARHEGKEEVTVAHPAIYPYLEETFGLVLYQEQVIAISNEIGRLSWADTNALRRALSKSYGEEWFSQYRKKFVAGAAQSGLSEGEANEIWDQINSFGSFAFNKSHSVSYAMVSYWTAYLKAHYPLEYIAAALRNEGDDEGVINLLREVVAEGVEYIPFDAELSEDNWTVKNGKLVGGFLSLKGVGPATAAAMIASRNNGGLTEKQKAKLLKARHAYADLYPAHTMWKDYYEMPESMGLQVGSRVLNMIDFPEGGEIVFIGLLVGKDSRDKNEDSLIKKRGGKRINGKTLFLDMRMMDDTSLTPYLVRIDTRDYEPMGRLILERGKEKRDWFLVRGDKLRGFPMVQVRRIKCLNDPELLTEN